MRETARRERFPRDAGELRAWLRAHPQDRRGGKGAVRKSTRADDESAKMATGKGVTQGYAGVATVDVAHQMWCMGAIGFTPAMASGGPGAMRR